ncbi:MAG TPA: hypothetical protein PLB21_06760 [Actinomycetota bacterium]|nr:hypothetical protein [Actinomycetota bacterium]
MDFLQRRATDLPETLVADLRRSHAEFLNFLEEAAASYEVLQGFCSAHAIDGHQLATLTGLDDRFAEFVTNGEPLESAIALNWLANHPPGA